MSPDVPLVGSALFQLPFGLVLIGARVHANGHDVDDAIEERDQSDKLCKLVSNVRYN